MPHGEKNRAAWQLGFERRAGKSLDGDRVMVGNDKPAGIPAGLSGAERKVKRRFGRFYFFSPAQKRARRSSPFSMVSSEVA